MDCNYEKMTKRFDRQITSERERRKYKTSLAKTIKKYETVHAAMAEGGVVHYGKHECPPENDEQNSEKYEEAKVKEEEFLQKKKEFSFLHQKIKIITKRLKDFEDAVAVAKKKLDEKRVSQED